MSPSIRLLLTRLTKAPGSRLSSSVDSISSLNPWRWHPSLMVAINCPRNESPYRWEALGITSPTVPAVHRASVRAAALGA